MSVGDLKAELLELRNGINEKRAELVLHAGLDMPYYWNRHQRLTEGTNSTLLAEAAGSLASAEQSLSDLIGHLSAAIEKYDNYIALR